MDPTCPGRREKPVAIRRDRKPTPESRAEQSRVEQAEQSRAEGRAWM
ncbi:unnamed protein product [Spirodela intermedia]|uniref:Uncharacterized protein n=1 Tax=Spirodela intermedia TaxID=51605 RepID=A0A7I8JIT6_SPIIN|nr:unnamed protein product [Spirodela intermedia]CAA6669433.1 unnamed protein product [Spirodela intermedia]